jgi:DNA mismatch repair ATPase MutS
VPGRIVERKVVQVLTPGTVIEDETKFNYIAGLSYTSQGGDQYHLAWGDVSLGIYYTASYTSKEEIMKHIFQLQPRELVIDIDLPDRDGIEQYTHDVLKLIISFDDIPHDVPTYIQHTTGTSSLVGYGLAIDG